jgi:CRISPR-associated endoribonuclease Cas6
MAWRDVHGPARAVVYRLLGERDPGLASALHDSGWRGSTLRPVGVSPPMFVGAARRAGTYTTSARGSVWLGSPVPEIARALLTAVEGRQELQWGAVALSVQGVQLEWAAHESGQAEFTSVSPVLIKHENRFLLPEDTGYLDRLVHNLRHKADVLGLPNEITAEILEAGPRRRFEVSGGRRIGACVRLRLTAAPALLDALYEWGLGLATIQGFGWVR